MKDFLIFWQQFDWLEFVTYIVIPGAMILVILTYILFTIRLLKLSFDIDLDFLWVLERLNTIKYTEILNKIENILKDEKVIVKELEAKEMKEKMIKIIN